MSTTSNTDDAGASNPDAGRLRAIALSRQLITSLIEAACDGVMPVLAENTQSKLAQPENGYLKFAISFDANGGRLLGDSAPTGGLISFTLAVAAGGGMANADAILEALRGAFLASAASVIRFSDFEIEPGRNAGQFWLIDASLDFALWGNFAEDNGA